MRKDGSTCVCGMYLSRQAPGLTCSRCASVGRPGRDACHMLVSVLLGFSHRLLLSCLPPGARVSVVVDAKQPLKLLADTAAAWCTSVDVLVEINAGQDRCVRV